MNKNLRTGFGLLIGTSVFFLCSTVAFFILKESEKEKRLYLEQELKEITTAKDAIATDLEEIKIINLDLESKLSAVKEEANRISEELAKAKEAKTIIISQFEEEKKKSDTLMADIMKEKEERLTLVHQVAKAEEAYRTLQEKFELMVETKETLENKLKDLMAKKGVELEKIEVESEYQPAQETEEATTTKIPPPAPETVTAANVLVVNKKFDFIVTNIGKLDGANPGTELDVYREGVFIAKTKIEKLYDNMSAATILPDWKNATIREGDQVYISQ